jgi:hypothetical protein
MRLGALVAILGDHPAYRDNFCLPGQEQSEEPEPQDEDAPRFATPSSPADWQG